MLAYQYQDSPQTVSAGIAEYFKAHEEHLNTRALTPAANEFFRCHDASHVVFGCDISLSDELVVKVSSVFGTTVGWNALKGYRLAESKAVYAELQWADVIQTAVSSLVLVPTTIWRCYRMQERWHWDNYDDFLDVPLVQVRKRFGIQVAH